MNVVKTKSVQHLRYHIGHDIIGPIIHRWLLGIEQHIAFFDDGDTRFLFCARAGVRIRELFKIYLKGRNRELPDSAHMFWISRLALCKGLYRLRPDAAVICITNEYRGEPIRNVVMGLLRHAPEILKACDLTTSDLDARSESFGSWLQLGSDTSRKVLDYLNSSSEAFNVELDAILHGSGRAVLIDSGWQGTGQSLLHHARPNVEWYGLYIGRILTPSHDDTISDRVIGLLLQAESFEPAKPETGIVLHRHLFETLLEPNAPSVEEIVGGPCDRIAKAQIEANETEKIDVDRDQIFVLVREYIENNSGLSLAEIMSRYQAAIPELSRLLSQPNQNEALAIFSKDRSTDFGKDLNVPVLISKTDAQRLPSKYASRDGRIQHALWQQGQIALEYTGKMCTDLQLRASGLADDRSYFDFASEKSNGVDVASPLKPLISIITRTKNRPLLLARAAESVANQSYDNYLWIVVNDGGDEDVVRDTIAKCSIDRRRIRLVSNVHSLGMEAASNAGIRYAQSDYVLIHDDDDSLHPNFLKVTVEYLESAAGARYGGAITRTEYVSEEICGDQVVIHDRYPFMDWVRNIQIAEMMAQNLFAPISFIYRRNLYEEIGGYNPKLPVLGDWYFNLEFILRADIKVLGDQPLAYYHHRDRGDTSRSSVYSNSVISGKNQHEEFASISRNMFVRQYADSGAFSAGILGAYFGGDLRKRIDQKAVEIHSTEIVRAKDDELRKFKSDLREAHDEADRLYLISQILIWQKETPRKLMNEKISIELGGSLNHLAELSQEIGLKLLPPDSFDDELYLLNNPDVEIAVKSGDFESGFQHYVLYARKEDRPRANRK